MSLTGQSIIAGWDGAGSGESVRAVDPASGQELDPEFAFVTAAAVDAAAEAARAAFDTFRDTAPTERAAFLEMVAANLESCRDEIVARAHAESGLPLARLEGELSRTTNQIRLFSTEVRAGSHQGVRIDEAQPDRAPLPAPDVRQRHIAVGPVAVFGPSNFPLAFSAAGGDVASALAAGCPVIVKAHNAHPGTAELAGSAIAEAVEACGLPGGVYSLLFGPGRTVGQALAAHPEIKAIAFTGSQAGGTALMATGAARAEPIPVYAEMSSINPLVVLAGAAAGDLEGLANGYVGSLTLGAGQFCTNPGLVLAPAPADALVEAIGSAVAQQSGQVMLTAGIRGAYDEGLSRLEAAGAARVCSGSAGILGQRSRPGAVHGHRGPGARVARPAGGGVRIGRAGGLLRIAGRAQGCAGGAAGAAHRLDPHGRVRLRGRSRAGAAAGAQGGPADCQRLADRGGGQPRHGARRAVPGHVRSPLHVGGHPGDTPVPAPGVLPELPAGPAAGGGPRRQPLSLPRRINGDPQL